MININGLDKVEVLRALYNCAHPLGMGYLHYSKAPLTRQEAEGALKRSTYFDYLNGRVMKVNLGADEFEELLYDRDNGEGAAESALRDAGLIAEAVAS